MMNTSKLCPNCKTGKAMYLIDSHSTECPYLQFHNGKDCEMFVKLEKSVFKDFFKRLFGKK